MLAVVVPPDGLNEYPSINNVESKLSKLEYDQFGLSKFAADNENENNVNTEKNIQLNNDLDIVKTPFKIK